MNTQSTHQLTPYVTLINGEVKTTSLKVAEYFGKQHKDVLRAIKNLECSKEFIERNFALIQIDVDLGLGRSRKSPAYEITRNGFMFLAMGFTGPEAAKLKEAYILTFDRMENELLDLERKGYRERLSAAQPVISFSASNNPFDKVSSGLLKNLNDVSPACGQAYLISKGVTPELVAHINANSSHFASEPLKIAKPEPMPLDVLVSRFVRDWFEGFLGAKFAPCLGSQIQTLFLRYHHNNNIDCPYGIAEFMSELYEHPSLYRQRVCVNKATDEHRVMVMINSLKPGKDKDFHVWVNECIADMDRALSNYLYHSDAMGMEAA